MLERREHFTVDIITKSPHTGHEHSKLEIFLTRWKCQLHSYLVHGPGAEHCVLQVLLQWAGGQDVAADPGPVRAPRVLYLHLLGVNLRENQSRNLMYEKYIIVNMYVKREGWCLPGTWYTFLCKAVVIIIFILVMIFTKFINIHSIPLYQVEVCF